MDGQGLIPDRGKICLFPIASRLALGPTQPAIWGGGISMGIMQPGREADPCLVPKSRMAWGQLYFFF
jgi:hypothetical protein